MRKKAIIGKAGKIANSLHYFTNKPQKQLHTELTKAHEETTQGFGYVPSKDEQVTQANKENVRIL